MLSRFVRIALCRASLLLSGLCALLVLPTTAARAQTVTITPDGGGIVTITQGHIGYLYGTIVNPTASLINIYGENVGGPLSMTYGKQTGILGSAVASLPIAANSSYHGLLATIDTSTGFFSTGPTPIGTYTPFVTINTLQANNASFTVNVVAAPEPSAVSSTLIGMISLGALLLAARRRSSHA